MKILYIFHNLDATCLIERGLRSTIVRFIVPSTYHTNTYTRLIAQSFTKVKKQSDTYFSWSQSNNLIFVHLTTKHTHTSDNTQLVLLFNSTTTKKYNMVLLFNSTLSKHCRYGRKRERWASLSRIGLRRCILTLSSKKLNKRQRVYDISVGTVIVVSINSIKIM